MALTTVTAQGLTQQLTAMSPDDIKVQTNAWVTAHGSDSEQLSAVRELLQFSCDQSEVVGEVILEAWEILKQRQIWRAEYATLKEALASLETPQIRDLRARGVQNRRRKEKYIKQIAGAWGGDGVASIYERFGENTLGALATLSSIYTENDVKSMATQVAIMRLRTRKGGRGSSRVISTIDLQRLSKMEESSARSLLNLPCPTKGELLEYGITGTLTIEPQYGPLEGDDGSLQKKRRRYPPVQRLEAVKVPQMQAVENTVTETTDDSDTNRDTSDTENNSSDASTTMNTLSTTGSFQTSRHSRTQRYRKRRKSIASSISPEGTPSPEQTRVHGCKCRNINASVLERIERKTRTGAGAQSHSQRYALFRTLLDSGETKQDLNHMCFKHKYRLGGKVGLQVKCLDHGTLSKRLMAYWDNRADIESFQKSEASKDWWRADCRPVLKNDDIGIYSIRPVSASVLNPLTDERRQLICESIAGPRAWKIWSETGNLIINSLFSWLWDGVIWEGEKEDGIGPLIDQEFDMYLYHQGKRNGIDNKGWLRTMIYSLTQQIIRQDLEYWMLYASLRPDLNVKLVSYPYYTKYAITNDQTFFRHIDLNVREYLETGQGANIIQGSVSFDEENNQMCTEIIPGFHHKISQWWEKVVARGKALDGKVTSLDKTWTKEDTIEFGPFVPVPCARGGVRITKPEIAHGSTGRGFTGVRRTILPWFVGVEEDDETLDTPDGESWNDLAMGHSRQTAVQLTPSGLPNKYGRLPYRFPASSQLILSNPVSQALVCRTTWSDPAVQYEANFLLGSDRAAAMKRVLKHRVEALRQYKVSFARVVAAEKRYYGTNSFFVKQG